MKQKIEIDISFTTILKLVLSFLAIYLVYIIRDVIALIFVTIIIVSAISPLVDELQKKMNRTLAASIVFAIFVLMIVGIIYAIVPPVAEQSKLLANNIPGYIERVAPYYQATKIYLPSLQNSFDKISSSLSSISGNIFAATAGVVGGIVSVITVAVLSFYLLIDEKAFKNSLFALIPPDKRDDAADIFKKIALKVGDWLRGQLTLGVVVGIIDLIGLLIIGVPYALTLALISMLFEIIPVVGPIISGIVAAGIALTVSPVTAVFVVILYIVVQQLENHILVPQIMKKAVGLSPVVIIVAIVIGAKLLGVAGALLAIPVAAVISVIAQDWNVVKRIFATE